MGNLARRLRLSTYLVPERRVIIRSRGDAINLNWGSVSLPEIPKMDGEISQASVMNYDIRVAASKIKTFEALGKAGIAIPRWDTDGNSLHKRLTESDREWMLARRDGLSKGAGIKLVKVSDNKIPDADFYVEKLSCNREFRAHVWRDKVICLQAKVVPPGCRNFIHNYENGCHYTTKDLERWQISDLGDKIESTSIAAVRAVGLDFGAVDLIVTKKGRLYVLEINTAPGLRSDATYEAYKSAILREIKKGDEAT